MEGNVKLIDSQHAQCICQSVTIFFPIASVINVTIITARALLKTINQCTYCFMI